MEWLGRRMPPGDVARLQQLEVDIAAKASAFSDLSGTIADAQVPESAVTQHEAAVRAGDIDIDGLAADATPDGAADYVVTHDADAGARKKVLLNNLPGGGGGGDNISVNGVAAEDADFDDATPAAPAGDLNVKWQKDAGTPNNLSAYVDVSALEPLVSHDALADWVAGQHRTINDVGVGATDLWSASNINTKLAAKANTIHTHAASEVTSGEFADARISQSSVFQHLIGSSFPVSPSDGDAFLNTTIGEWFVWDASNSAWLGTTLHHYSFGIQASANDKYINRVGGSTMAQSRGTLLHFDIAIVRVTANNNVNLTSGNIRIRRSNAATNVVSLATTGNVKTWDSGAVYATMNKSTGNLDGGMTVYLDTLSASSVSTEVLVWFRRRET